MTFLSARFFTDHIFSCFLFVIIYVKSFFLVAIKRENENYSLVLRSNSNAGTQNRRILNNDGDLCFNQ